MATPQPTWRTVTLTTLGAVVAMAALTIAVERADARYAWSGEVEHATGHLALAGPLLALTVAAVRLWPAPRPTQRARTARRLLVAGLAIVSVGQVLEVLGAFGYDGDERARPVLATAHDVGLVGGPFGMLLVVGGIALALQRSRAALGAADLALLAVGVVGIAAVFIGIPPVVGVLIIIGAGGAFIGRTMLSRASAR